MPLADVLLILLLIRLLFPRIFISGKKFKEREKSRIFVHAKKNEKTSDQKNDRGEYIEYEEIK